MTSSRPHASRERAALLLVLGASVLACAGASPFDGARLAAEDEVEIMAVLDRYMDALNALDLEAHVATYHFPHYRHASGRIEVWPTPEAAMPLLRVAPADRRAALRRALEPDWHRSVWTHRRIVQAGSDKAHVVTRFERLRADGSVIKRFDSLYVMTRQPDARGVLRWGIRGRSSFAP